MNDVLKWDLWWLLRPLRPQPLPGETPSATPAEGQKEAPKEGPSNGEQADGQAQKPRRQFSRRRQRNSDSTTSKVKYHLVQCLGKSVGCFLCSWTPVWICFYCMRPVQFGWVNKQARLVLSKWTGCVNAKEGKVHDCYFLTGWCREVRQGRACLTCYTTSANWC